MDETYIDSCTIVYHMNNVIWQMRERFGATSGQKSPKERKYHQKLLYSRSMENKGQGLSDKFLDRF